MPTGVSESKLTSSKPTLQTHTAASTSPIFTSEVSVELASTIPQSESLEDTTSSEITTPETIIVTTEKGTKKVKNEVIEMLKQNLTEVCSV